MAPNGSDKRKNDEEQARAELQEYGIEADASLEELAAEVREEADEPGSAVLAELVQEPAPVQVETPPDEPTPVQIETPADELVIAPAPGTVPWEVLNPPAGAAVPEPEVEEPASMPAASSTEEFALTEYHEFLKWKPFLIYFGAVFLPLNIAAGVYLSLKAIDGVDVFLIAAYRYYLIAAAVSVIGVVVPLVIAHVSVRRNLPKPERKGTLSAEIVRSVIAFTLGVLLTASTITVVDYYWRSHLR
jgi:hypothetical protein